MIRVVQYCISLKQFVLFKIYIWGFWLEWVNGETDCTTLITFQGLMQPILMGHHLQINGINVLGILQTNSLFLLNLIVKFPLNLVISVIKPNNLEINFPLVTVERLLVLRSYIVIYGGSIILNPLVVLLIFLLW